MFDDLRKGSMFMGVNRTNTGESPRLTSTHQDMVNSTASHDVRPSKNGMLWYSGSTASATGSLKLLEVNENGDYVRVNNASSTEAEDV
uniref:Uncharacterized protein n=1 Tax=Ciona savignyi TaxID=51511 RepID=H2YLM6_CIOSA